MSSSNASRNAATPHTVPLLRTCVEGGATYQPTKRERRELDGGHCITTVNDGPRITGVFHIEIDVAKLLRMIGDKALRSKRNVSKLQDGAVVVRVVERRPVA